MALITLEYKIDHTMGKKFTRPENNIDIGRRATEMCPNIKAIDICLFALKIYILPNAAAILQPCNFFHCMVYLEPESKPSEHLETLTGTT